MDILKQLKKTSVTRSKRLWYTRKKKMRKNILAALQVFEMKISRFLENFKGKIHAHFSST